MSTPSTSSPTASTAPTVPAPSAAPVAGRPRDRRIDGAVLRATIELLEEVGYLQLTIGAIAERAGTNKPAVYRRWPTKAHLVHEAVFPADGPEVIPVGADLRTDIRALVLAGLDILGRPAARAALPGLLAETANDAGLRADVLDRFATGTWGWLQDRIERGVAAGEIRAGVSSTTVLEIIAGSTFVALAIRPRDEIGDDWVDDVVQVILRGIAP